MSKLLFYINNPRIAFFWIWWKCSRLIPSDELYLKVYFYLKMGTKLNFQNPITFNEKIQWLKLNNTTPKFTQMVDKHGVRELIGKELGEEYLFPLLGVWDTFDEINFNNLPNQFVLKATHDSGSYIICKDKSNLNLRAARKKLTKRLSQNYFYSGREYPYKKVKPRIIAEKLMVDESGTELKDYKFYCFHGNPEILLISSGRTTDITFDFYDMKLNRLRFVPGKGGHINKPITEIPSFEKMKEIARKLSRDLIMVRVDLYNINGIIYFGEFTFHDGGGVNNVPCEWDRKLGDMITLPFDK